MMRLVIALCVISMSLLIANVKSNESKQKSSTDTMVRYYTNSIVL